LVVAFLGMRLEMIEDELKQLLQDIELVPLPDSLIDLDFSLLLVKSNDSKFIHNIPEPYRSRIIEFALRLDGKWYSMSNNGTVDHSQYAEPLKKLVFEYLNNKKY
jgi:hypothetical protein